jgi:hypothetical protein
MGLIKRGHSIGCYSISSIVQGIHVNRAGEIYAYADPRKGGSTNGI